MPFQPPAYRPPDLFGVECVVCFERAQFSLLCCKGCAVCWSCVPLLATCPTCDKAFATKEQEEQPPRAPPAPLVSPQLPPAAPSLQDDLPAGWQLVAYTETPNEAWLPPVPAARQAAKPVLKSGQLKMVLCSFWLKNARTCRFGDTCGFAHGSSDFNPLKESCFYDAASGCPQGERCRRRHARS
jgi:hypothetical protein